ncbi:MAG: GTPase [Thermofilum sp. ex4484_15]|nr:MAG: GTPase [Thermofilum sp. ex4484_15]
MKRKVIIMGAGGRDFHNFNVFFRDNPDYQVVAFTAGQIPNIDNRLYPPSLSGKLYPNGIPIYSEEKLEEIIKREGVDEVVLSYSDLSYVEVMKKAARVLAAGASFKLLGPNDTMLKSSKPVIAVCAVRTGAGKSTVSRALSSLLRNKGVKHVIVRHPMAYGDLEKQAVQRFEKLEDLDKYGCTIEEREEYEPHLENGVIVYAGVDYVKILSEAEKEAEVIIWDGGNNDWPFFKPDLMITVVDPLRPGDEVNSYPGEVNLRLADVVIVNKVNVANNDQVKKVKENVSRVNPRATIIEAESLVKPDRPELIRGKRVLVVEDGPTVTHGNMSYGAGYVAAREFGAAEIVDPRPYAVGSIADTFRNYPNLGPVLPAMGYGLKQMKELEATVNKVPCDSVVLGTPSNISRYLKINKPVVRVRYEIKVVNGPSLGSIIGEFLRSKGVLKP